MIHDDFLSVWLRVLFPLTGRQVKMAYVNSVAKPPRDVRRRQEKFGTTSGSTASSTAAAAPIKWVQNKIREKLRGYLEISW